MKELELSPTLWRTCRVLVGPTRFRLLAELVCTPNRTVSDLAEALRISRSRTSQELRRLQSRGLLKANRQGRWVRYTLAPDPRVPSAAPLVKALRATLGKRGRETEGVRMASALTHPRRLCIVQALLAGPRPFADLARGLDMPAVSLARHLRGLRDRGVLSREGGAYRLVANPHPLARCLMRLVKTSRGSLR